MSQTNVLKVPVKQAKKTLNIVMQLNLKDQKFKPKSLGENFYIPLKMHNNSDRKKELKKILKKNKINFFFTQVKLEKAKAKKKNLREALKNKLSKKELEKLITSFNVLGDIAVIEIPEELQAKEKLIGQTLLELNSAIKVVCKKAGITQGKFRVFPVKVIAGEKRTLSLYKEHGCKFKVDIAKVFFSPRLSHERLRIAKQIKKGEIVGVFFAGVGPFAIVFAKNSPVKKVFAVELNPVAFDLMQENIVLNKVEDKIEAFFGDVKKVVPKQLKGKCDRVVMPLPKSAELFLNEAILALKPKGGIIHFDFFVERDNPFSEIEEIVSSAVAKHKKKFKILRKAKIRNFSPSIIQIGVDFKVF